MTKNYLSRIKSRIKKDKDILRKLIYTVLSRGISAMGTFIFNFVLAKFLGVKDFGNFMLAYSILIGMGFLSRFGMSSAIIRFGAIMYNENNIKEIKKLRLTVLRVFLITSSTSALFLMFFKDIISYFFFDNAPVNNVLLFFSLALPFYSYLIIQSAFLKAFKRPEIAPFFEVGLSTFLTGAGILLLAWIG